jgi:hypothetical protein
MGGIVMDDMLIEQVEYKGYVIKVCYEDDILESPREWDNLGTMVCWHSRYNLGDEQPKCDPEEFLKELAMEIDPRLEDTLEHWESGNGWAMLNNRINKEMITAEEGIAYANKMQEKAINRVLDNNVLMLPLYLYDHSGITMNTTGFSCGWDSGQVGFIYVTKYQLKQEYGISKVMPIHWKKAEERLKAEVKVYDRYIRGDVYCYTIHDKNEDIVVDSLGGLYEDSTEEIIKMAKEWIDYEVTNSINGLL